MEEISLSELVTLSKEFVTINDPKDYMRCRVQLHRRGIVLRDVVKGHAIKTKKQQVCKAGQLLVAEIDAKVGGYGIVPKELDGSIVSSHYFLFDINENKLERNYLEQYLKTDYFFRQIKAKGSTNYASIRPKDILAITMPLPDSGKQKTISTRLASFWESNRKIAELRNKNLEQVQTLRQSILREAIQGKLVPQNPSDEPASELLTKIKAEREKLAKEGKIRKSKVIAPVLEEEIPHTLPKGWEVCRFSEIVILGRGASPRPIDSYITTSEDGINWIKIGDSGSSKYITSTAEKITSEGAKKSVRVSVGDLIMSNSMSFGRPYVLMIDGCIHDGWLYFHFNSEYLFRDYLYYYLQSQTSYYEVKASGTGVRNLNINRVAEMPTLLPPYKEQKRIVSRVDQLIKLCDELEIRIKENEKNSNMLLDATLRAAFAVNQNQLGRQTPSLL